MIVLFGSDLEVVIIFRFLWKAVIFFGDLVNFLFPRFDNEGLKNTRWCGRNQVIVRPSVTFYLDGAHTRRSIEVCLGNRNAAFSRILKLNFCC